MSLYEFLLFVHLAGAVVWVGGGVSTQFFALRALRTKDTSRIAALAADIEWVGSRVLTTSSLITFLAGLALVWESEAWGFGDDWIVIGLALFAVTFVAGAGFFGPESGRISRLVATDGAGSRAAQARIRRILVLARIDLILLFLIIFDMTVKPSFSDGWTIVLALASAIALAALLTVRRGGSLAKPASATAD
jgi:uncharacterized membrane protein